MFFKLCFIYIVRQLRKRLSKDKKNLDFEFSTGGRHMGAKNSVLLWNSSRRLWVKTVTARKTKDWQEEVKNVLTGRPGTF